MKIYLVWMEDEIDPILLMDIFDNPESAQEFLIKESKGYGDNKAFYIEEFDLKSKVVED